MVDKELFDIFQDVKETLCKYDYYIHTSKKILHLTHTEDQIPHLMGLQYIHNEKFIGDSGAYLIKKKRLKRNSLARIVSRIYRKKKLQESILDMIDRKLDNLEHLNEMLSSPSVIYLYDPGKNPESELRTDYLMVYKDAKKVIQLGLVKSKTKEKVYIIAIPLLFLTSPSTIMISITVIC